MRPVACVLAVLFLAGCAGSSERRPFGAGTAAYQVDGTWYYPRPQWDLDETGLGLVLADRSAGRRTSGGEMHDPTQLTAAHTTLPLPAIVRVTNLENGRQLVVRVNDRGPFTPGRIIAVSRRAGDLLGMNAAGATRVRITLLPADTRALGAAGGGAGAEPPLQIAAAPRGAVQADDLAPPPGARAAARVVAAPVPVPVSATLDAAPVVPDRLPETVIRTAPAPGRLWIQAGTFSTRATAERQRALLATQGAVISATGAGRQVLYRVRIGPLDDVSQADAALARARRAVPDTRIVVEGS